MRKTLSILFVLVFVVTLFTAAMPSLLSFQKAAAATTVGDANFDDAIDMKDVLIIRKYLAALVEDYNIDVLAADCNQDASLDMKDVLMLRKYLAHMETLPEAKETSSVPTTTTGETPTSKPTESSPATNPTTPTPTTAGKMPIDLTMVPDQILLSYYDVDATEMGVTWHNTVKSSKPVVEYVKVSGSETPDFSQAEKASATRDSYQTQTWPFYPDTNTFYYDSKGFTTITDYAYHAVMDNLDFDSTYAYRVGDEEEGSWSRTGTFKTRKETVDSFSFIYTSDTQVSSIGDQKMHTYMKKGLDAAVKDDPNLSFLIQGGDFVQNSNRMYQWQMHIDGNSEFLMKYPTMMVTGNHESTHDTAGQYEIFKHTTVDLPSVDMDKKLGIYYSFNYGNAHFVILNTDEKSGDKLSSTQAAWLESDLKANTQKWTIVAMHRPIVALRESTDPSALRSQLAPLFVKYGVDFVIQAHEHVFTRSYVLDEKGQPIKDAAKETSNGVEYYKDPAGFLVATFAAGGSSDRSPSTKVNESLCEVYGDGQESSFANFTITGDTLTVRALYASSGSAKAYDGGQWGIKK